MSSNVSDQDAAAFERLKPYLPKDLDVAKVGGYENLQKLSDNPKQHLLGMIKSLQNDGDASAVDNLDAIVALLYAQGQGFDSDLVDGEWVLVLQRQGSKSPKFQKLVGKGESRIGNSYSTFDVNQRQFRGEVKLIKGLLTVSSTVQYTPVSDNFDVHDDKIVLRRIACDIVKAGIKGKFLPRLGLPFLRKKGGFLDFVYLDRDLRVTTGSRGGLFVHARPLVARKLSASSKSS